LITFGERLVICWAIQAKPVKEWAIMLFVILVAAAEAAIALSLLVGLYRKLGTVSLDDFRALKG
jgi:NADH:ubiquinone oxidoreductase subunit K